jgi:hypothetical protein
MVSYQPLLFVELLQSQFFYSAQEFHHIVTHLIRALLGNGLVNTFSTRSSGNCVSVDECYSLLLGNSQHTSELAG